MRSFSNWKFTYLIAIPIVIALFVGAVAYQSNALPIKLYTFTEKNNGKNATIPQNNTFYVVLHENPTTGYKWQLKTTPGLTILSDKYVQSAPPIPGGAPIVGQGGYHIWTIRTNKPGSYKICAAYKRSWEKGSIETFTMKINVVWLNPLIK